MAERSGLSVGAIRYYEKRGLLETPRRSVGGYREYPDSVLERRAFIDRGKDLGFSRAEDGELLALRPLPRPTAGR